MKKITHQEILQRKPKAQAVKKLPRTPCCLVVDNVRSLYNIGSFFRSSDAVLIEKIYLCGIAGTPPEKEIDKTALGATEVVPWEYFASVEDCLEHLKDRQYNIYGLELTHESLPYFDTQFKFPMALVVGNEVDGISDEALEYVDLAVDIPMLGRANSLNVATAYAVTAYEILRQYRYADT